VSAYKKAVREVTQSAGGNALANSQSHIQNRRQPIATQQQREASVKEREELERRVSAAATGGEGMTVNDLFSLAIRNCFRSSKRINTDLCFGISHERIRVQAGDGQGVDVGQAVDRETQILSELLKCGIGANDIRIYEGKDASNTMRGKPANLMTIPSLNRSIVYCNWTNEDSFVLQSIAPHQATHYSLAEMGKEGLKAIGATRIIHTSDWTLPLRDALFKDKSWVKRSAQNAATLFISLPRTISSVVSLPCIFCRI
jgi:hypothetical protein